MSTTPPDPLLSTRSALVLLLAVLVGIGAGMLTFLGGEPWATSLLAGFGAAAAATLLFHSVIG